MGIAPRLLMSNVMHKRLTPRVNAFTYGVYYVAAPLSNLESLSSGWMFGVNRPGIFSLHEKDYGARDGTPARDWIDGVLRNNNIPDANGETVLITMPRIFGYAFNPVSFWLCYDQDENLRAVLCEVNNTFHEHHMYLCAHDDRGPIEKNDWLSADKVFHVSPFLEREGHYKFRFAQENESLGIWIDHFDGDGEKKLLTAVTGKMVPFTRKNLSKAFVRYPFETLKVITLIHWQAVKIWAKRIRYVPKPDPVTPNFSTTENLTKN